MVTSYTGWEERSFKKSCELPADFHFFLRGNYMDIEHWYQRLADNNEINLARAKRLLKGGELEEFHWTVDQYIKASRENAVEAGNRQSGDNHGGQQDSSRAINHDRIRSDFFCGAPGMFQGAGS